LLRVVQAGERAHLVVTELGVVEQDAGHEQRPGERPPPRLVGAGDEARPELAVELEQLPSGASRHGSEHSAALSRCRNPARSCYSATVSASASGSASVSGSTSASGSASASGSEAASG